MDTPNLNEMGYYTANGEEMDVFVGENDQFVPIFGIEHASFFQ